MDKYPIIILPEELFEIDSAVPEVPDMPIEPQKPPLCYPDKPVFYSSNFSKPKPHSLPLMLGVIGLLYILFGRENIHNEYDFFWGVIFLLFVLFGLRDVILKGYQKSRALENFENQTKKYNDEKTSIAMSFSQRENNYSAKYDAYLKEKESYEKKMQEFNNSECQIKFRHENIMNWKQTATRPTKSNSMNKKGITEPYFFSLLKLYFKDKIFDDYVIVVDEFEGIPYRPDFVYYDETTNLLIDIEIDEPYELNDKNPIHCDFSEESQRNSFFLSHNWFVIRFAEEQIVKYPYECLLILYNFIADIGNFESNFLDYYYHDIYKLINRGEIIHKELVLPCELKLIDIWEDEAITMAKNNYRNMYLGFNPLFQNFEKGNNTLLSAYNFSINPKITPRSEYVTYIEKVMQKIVTDEKDRKAAAAARVAANAEKRAALRAKINKPPPQNENPEID